MEHDVIVKQFEAIENKVDGLVKRCRQLAATNSELKDQVKRLESELQNKVEEEQRYQAERDLIRSKVDSLLGRLEDMADSPS